MGGQILGYNTKDKIVYIADIFNSNTETQILVPGLWMPSTHDEKKAYVPKPGA